jgi:hypothetical protein
LGVNLRLALGIAVVAVIRRQQGCAPGLEPVLAGSRRAVLEPERRLMLAVLRDAVKVVQLYAGSPQIHHRRLFHEADVWFATADRSNPFGFGAICDALGLDATRFYACLRLSLRSPQ